MPSRIPLPKFMMAMGFFNNDALLPFSQDFSGLADGALPAGWTGATWAIASGKAVNTPTLTGSNLLADGGLETWASDTDLTSWTETIAGTSTVNKDAAEKRTGSFCARLDIDASNSNAQIQQTVSGLTAGQWYRFGLQMKSNLANKPLALAAVGYSVSRTGTVYGELATVAFPGGTAAIVIINRATGSNSSSLYVDDCDVHAVDIASMVALRPPTVKDIIAKAAVNIPANSAWATGVVVNYVDGNNLIAGYINRANAYLISRIGGTHTTKISAAITYVDGAEVEVRKSGDLYELWYDNIQVGTTQQITNATINASVLHGIFGTGAAGGVQAFSLTPFRHVVETAYASPAQSPLTILTYDGSNESTHPDVYYNAAGWNGKKYWMVMTPYPSPDFENPSILVSDNGNDWAVPNGLTNPVIPDPGGTKYNNDPDIVVDGSGVMWMFYAEALADTYDRIYVVSSPDGVTWSAPTLVVDGTFPDVLSPAVLWDGSQWVMYSITGAGVLQRRTCATPSGTWSAAAVVTVLKPSTITPWHIDVIYDNGIYYALVMSSVFDLYFGRSTNGTTFVVSSNPIIKKADAAWTTNRVYRGCLVRTASGFDTWYSGFSATDFGTIGRCAIVYSE
jgi:hypothetical protein